MRRPNDHPARRRARREQRPRKRPSAKEEYRHAQPPAVKKKRRATTPRAPSHNQHPPATNARSPTPHSPRPPPSAPPPPPLPLPPPWPVTAHSNSTPQNPPHMRQSRSRGTTQSLRTGSHRARWGHCRNSSSHGRHSTRPSTHSQCDTTGRRRHQRPSRQREAPLTLPLPPTPPQLRSRNLPRRRRPPRLRQRRLQWCHGRRRRRCRRWSWPKQPRAWPAASAVTSQHFGRATCTREAKHGHPRAGEVGQRTKVK